MFIVLDGGDGAGKSSQLQMLIERLEASGREVVTCRDPGGTEVGESVREILLHRHHIEICPMSETLLYMASRAQLVESIIRPALEAGKTVISDRFLLANVVYQGHGRGLDIDQLWEIGAVATGGLEPDLTIVFDVPPETAAGRISGEPDRMEQQGDEFHARVREGFIKEAERQSDRIAVIDASPSIKEVHEVVWAAVEKRFPE
jgi:dTMP kinase